MTSRIVTAVLLGFFLVSCTDTAKVTTPNVIIVILDSLRAENVSCYGYERTTTPNIDSLAAHGTIWANCISQSSWTLPSTVTILTGTTERSHGAGRREKMEYMLHPDAPSLPAILNSMGYRTYGSFNVAHLDERHGTQRGFQSFSCQQGDPLPADQVILRFTDWLETVDNHERFFAVLHFFDPHMPYNPPAPYDTLFGPLAEHPSSRWMFSEDGEVLDPENRDHYLSLYDGETAFADAELGRMFAMLREENIAEETIIIILSDHGEEFLEHGGTFHGHAFYQEVIHVPLIITGPGVPPGYIDSSWVGLFDVAPTVLNLIAADPPDVMEGLDLLTQNSQERVIPSSGLFDDITDLTEPWIGSVIVHDVKTMRLDHDSCFTDIETNLIADPEEREYSEVESSLIMDNYITSPRLWELISAESADSLNPALEDLGYF